MKIVSIDQSYTSTGVCYHNVGEGIEFYRVQLPAKESWVLSAREVVSAIHELIPTTLVDRVVIESPVVGGVQSPALHGLYGMIMDMLLQRQETGNIVGISSVPANYLKSFYGKRSPSKGEMKDFAVDIISRSPISWKTKKVSGAKNTLISPRDINGDEAEAFLLGLFGYSKRDLDVLMIPEQRRSKLDILTESMHSEANSGIYWY